jgi:glycine/D-amino acid oxidase-like deaminating enzyme
MKSANIVICGAGIAGISTAFYLAVHNGVKDILLVDERAPLTFTSDKSSECYRNWWPGPGNEMVALMNRSIDLMEQLADESGNIFHMNRRGYLYLTADETQLPAFELAAREPSTLGAGPLRTHRGGSQDPAYIPAPREGYRDLPTGADLFLDPELIQKYFPYLPEHIIGALHVRRAGWLSAQQMGVYMLARARAQGVRTQNARVTEVEVVHGRIKAVKLSNGETIATRNFVNAAGPFTPQVGALLGLDLPIHNHLHLKVAFKDVLGVVPREAPLLIWNDCQTLPWNPEERQWLAKEPDTRWLLEQLPPGAHTRPEGTGGSDIILLLWDYHAGTPVNANSPTSTPSLDDMFPEIAMRGMAAVLPRFSEYFERIPRPMLDGGYYTRTPENRPLIGPLPIEGAYILGALSGFGMMAACASGELLAAHITGDELPPYSPAFKLERYNDLAYQQLLKNWGNEGQL